MDSLGFPHLALNTDLKTHITHYFNFAIADVSLTLPIKSVAAEIFPSPHCFSV